MDDDRGAICVEYRGYAGFKREIGRRDLDLGQTVC